MIKDAAGHSCNKPYGHRFWSLLLRHTLHLRTIQHGEEMLFADTMQILVSHHFAGGCGFGRMVGSMRFCGCRQVKARDKCKARSWQTINNASFTTLTTRRFNASRVSKHINFKLLPVSHKLTRLSLRNLRRVICHVNSVLSKGTNCTCVSVLERSASA